MKIYKLDIKLRNHEQDDTFRPHGFLKQIIKHKQELFSAEEAVDRRIAEIHAAAETLGLGSWVNTEIEELEVNS